MGKRRTPKKVVQMLIFLLAFDVVLCLPGIKKLSVPVLVQLSEDLARAVIEYNRSLQHELVCNEKLKLENQLSRDFISLTLSIERKQQQLTQCHLDADGDSFTASATSDGMV